jgi:hypothetical protein
MYSSTLLLQEHLSVCFEGELDDVGDHAGSQGSDLLSVQFGGMEAGLIYEHFVTKLLSPSIIDNCALLLYSTSVGKFLGVEHTASWQVVLSLQMIKTFQVGMEGCSNGVPDDVHSGRVVTHFAGLHVT